MESSWVLVAQCQWHAGVTAGCGTWPRRPRSPGCVLGDDAVHGGAGCEDGRGWQVAGPVGNGRCVRGAVLLLCMCRGGMVSGVSRDGYCSGRWGWSCCVWVCGGNGVGFGVECCCGVGCLTLSSVACALLVPSAVSRSASSDSPFLPCRPRRKWNADAVCASMAAV